MRVWQGGHWTLDNASNNGTFMIEFGNLLRARDINFDPIDRQVMCFPHIINMLPTCYCRFHQHRLG